MELMTFGLIMIIMAGLCMDLGASWLAVVLLLIGLLFIAAHIVIP